MRYNLAQMIARKRKPRRAITFRPIIAPSMFATDLFVTAYQPVVNEWGKGLPAILAAYERALSGMTMDSPANVGVEISRVENAATGVMLTVRARLERWAARIEAWHRSKWRAAVLSGGGIDIGMLIGSSDARMTVEAAIEANVGLVRSVSDQTRERITGAVTRGLQSRSSSADVAKEIRESTGMARRRARNVAADQNVKITSQLNEERRRQAGIDKWKWVSSHKLHPRPEHAARDGKVYDDTELLDDRPGMKPFCGCTSQAHLDLDALIAGLAQAA
jgi:SPP1 gp7 family putative phage head morphogenesis protein